MAQLATIAEDDNGIRIDRWFQRHYPALTHGHLEKLLRKGEVRLDGKRAKSADRVVTGQALRLPPQLVSVGDQEKPRPEPQQKPMGSLQEIILYMDKHVIVLNKPSGLATQGGSGLTRHVDGMLDSLSFEKNIRPKLVHRLDRDTSGVLLVARTAQSASGLSQALALRDATKTYWALVRGVPKQKQGVVKGALAKEGSRGKDERMAMVDDEDEGAKAALTEYAVMATAGSEFAWVAARPLTGRTHQIRVHLASLGTPIVGDFKYGGAEARGRGEIVDRLHLHARAIDIHRPDGGRLAVTAPMPPHMVKSWQVLGFNAEDKRDPFPSRIRKKAEAPAPRPAHGSNKSDIKKTAPRKTVLKNKDKPKKPSAGSGRKRKTK